MRRAFNVRFLWVTILGGALLGSLAGCQTAPTTEPLPRGLLVALAVLDKDDAGKPVPLPARMGILSRGTSGWEYQSIEDPASNVFHKAMVYEPEPGRPGILTRCSLR